MVGAIRLLAYADGKNCTALRDKIAAQYVQAFAEVDFPVFNSLHPMLQQLSADFQTAKIIFLFVEEDKFLQTKELLLRSLALPGEPNEMIIRQLELMGELTADEIAAHALMPAQAQVFLTEDAKYSGFVAQSGPQHFFYLPASEASLDTMLHNGMRDFMADLLSAQDIQKAPVVPPVALAEDTAKKEQQMRTMGQAALDGLREKNMNVSVAKTKYSSYVFDAFYGITEYEDYLREVDCEVEKTGLQQKEYIATLAKFAQKESGSSLGAAISGVFSSKEENGACFVYIGIANEEFVRVLKVYGLPDETPRDLMDEAVSRLLDMIAQYVKDRGFSLPDNVLELPQEKKRRRRSGATIAICIGVAALVCVLMVLMLQNVQGQTVDVDPQAAGNSYVQAYYDDVQWADDVTVQAGDPATGAAEQQHGQTPYHTTMPAPGLETQVPQTLEDVLGSQSTERSDETRETGGTTQKRTSSENTTWAPVITKAPTTTRKAEPTTKPVQKNGTFTFTTYGYGHGVGMSQEGAKAYANQGKTYSWILTHYYPGTSVKTDTAAPKDVAFAGKSYDIITYLARTVQAEIGPSAPTEALKAQAVAAYSYAKYYNFSSLNSNKHVMADTAADRVVQAVKAVVQVDGNRIQAKYLEYNGKAVFASYFASSAGKTVASQQVWGGTQSQYPYLTGGVDSIEPVSKVQKQFTADEIRNKVTQYNATVDSGKRIVLQANPAQWFRIVSHDKAVNGNVGYITQMQVGNQTMSGYYFRHWVLGLSIRSHCFAVSYQ